jgi:hypothetical protein
MQRTICSFFLLATAFLAMGAANPPSADNGPEYHPGGIYLPPVDGASAMSASVSAQADYIEAMGGLIESAAAARSEKTKNTEAAKQEVRGALDWVSTYFDRRELSRAYSLKSNPVSLGNDRQRQEILNHRVSKLLTEVLRGDPTAELNWLLHQLAGMALPYQYLPGNKNKTSPGGDIDVPLTPAAIHQIILTDGGRRNGQLLTFPADTAKILETPWPRALQAAEFAPLRDDFEKARDQTLAARTKGKRDWDAERRLMAACDALGNKFNEAYPHEVRVRSCDQYLTYAAGKRFLQALAAGVLRAMTTDDQWVFNGSYRFEGDTALELVQHMCEHGLEFAPCHPGGEGVYRALFENLRGIYLRLGANDPNRDLDRQE